MNIEDFITFFNRLFDEKCTKQFPISAHTFVYGGCFDFAKILKKYYENGIFMVDGNQEELLTHCAFYYEGISYDINGDITKGFFKDEKFYIASDSDISHMEQRFRYSTSLINRVQKLDDNYLEIIYMVNQILPYEIDSSWSLSFLKQYNSNILHMFNENIDSKRTIGVSQKASALCETILNIENRKYIKQAVEAVILLCTSIVFRKKIEKASDILSWEKSIEDYTRSFKKDFLAFLNKPYTTGHLEEKIFAFFTDIFLIRDAHIEEVETYKKTYLLKKIQVFK